MGRTGRWTVAVVLAVASGVFGVPAAASAAFTGSAQVGVGFSLNVRSGPSRAYPVIRKVSHDAVLAVSCHVAGQMVSGSVRETNLWDRLTDGRYISDAYVNWPGERPAIDTCSVPANVVANTGINVRRNASTLLEPVGRLGPGAPLTVVCQVTGESVAGDGGRSELWDRMSSGDFVTDAFVRWPGSRPDLPWCSFSAEIAPAAGEPFVAWAAWYAQQTKATYRVPAAVTIAQAILESGWGRSGLTRDGNSYFGMKCFGTPGPTAAGCRSYPTSECANGSCSATTASFRVYDSVLASFEDHSRALATLVRYRGAFAYANDPDRFATAIADAGYATSPTYAQDLIRVMREHQLYRFDGLG
jgi:uncharacterized protein YraI